MKQGKKGPASAGRFAGVPTAAWTVSLIFALFPSCRGAVISSQVLVDAELAFAKRTAEAGVREGFLAFLSEDSVVFRPRPVNGREAYEKSQPGPAVLTWYPAYAEISASGDLGYTTGPYEVFKSREEKTPASFGHYVSLWRKQSGGDFKVVLDAGVPHDAHPSKPPIFVAPAGAETRQGPRIGRARAELASLERELSEAAAVRGLVPAIESRLGPGVRVYREGRFPALGIIDALALLRQTEGRLSWIPSGIEAAESGELGYSYGLAQGEAATPGAYAFLRIWRRSAPGRWVIVLDLTSAIRE